jgi:hypothetical protein
MSIFSFCMVWMCVCRSGMVRYSVLNVQMLSLVVSAGPPLSGGAADRG